jgi:molybdopterin molybdotransferase
MNSYSIPAMIRSLGAEPALLGVARDTKASVREKLMQAADADLILSTAGVSVGAYDVVKDVMEELGAIGFWKVNMRPGKPLAYGHIQHVPYLGLPGNPVSALASFEIFVRPAILKMLGQSTEVPTVEVAAGHPMKSDGRESYIRVVLKREGGRLVAYETGTQSSGAISSLVLADGLLVIPADVTEVHIGDTFQVRPFAGQPIWK